MQYKIHYWLLDKQNRLDIFIREGSRTLRHGDLFLHFHFFCFSALGLFDNILSTMSNRFMDEQQMEWRRMIWLELELRRKESLE